MDPIEIIDDVKVIDDVEVIDADALVDEVAPVDEVEIDEPDLDPPSLFAAAEEAAEPDADEKADDGRDGLGETLFVEAGAGSGKTTLLVTRIVNLVLETGVSLASIAAITFTEAAALELQTRVRAKFEQEQTAAEKAGDQDRARNCEQAIADSDLAAITTLHGFANRILGEFAVAAGLPPQVRVLDEVASQLAQEARWERFVDRLYEFPDNHDLLQAASALAIPIEPRYPKQSTMRQVGEQFNQNWDRLDSLIDRSFGPLADLDFAAFDNAVDALSKRPDDCILTDDKLFAHLHEKLAEMMAIRTIEDPLRKLRLRALTGATDWGPGTGGRKEAWRGADTVTQIKAEIKRVTEIKEEVMSPIRDSVLMRLSQLIASETRAALLVLARNVLRTDDHARATLHDRFQHLLLDEFQDTDPLQIELAVLIATSAEDVSDSRWYELPVDPGRLFFVGDPKQSIYRFRRADIKLFLQARDRFSGSSGAAQLKSNFRSVEPIVAWVNALFFTEMPAEVPDQQPEYQSLVANREPAPGLGAAEAGSRLHRPVLLGGPHENPKVKAAELPRRFPSCERRSTRATSGIASSPARWFTTRKKSSTRSPRCGLSTIRGTNSVSSQHFDHRCTAAPTWTLPCGVRLAVGGTFDLPRQSQWVPITRWRLRALICGRSGKNDGSSARRCCSIGCCENAVPPCWPSEILARSMCGAVCGSSSNRLGPSKNPIRVTCERSLNGQLSRVARWLGCTNQCCPRRTRPLSASRRSMVRRGSSSPSRFCRA